MATAAAAVGLGILLALADAPHRALTPTTSTATSASSPGASLPLPTFSLAQVRAPVGRWPLPELATPERTSTPPTLATLTSYLYGDKPLYSLAPGAALTDWRITSPNQDNVAGYADATSVEPGGSIGFHIAGHRTPARIDIFRLGLGDGQHLLTIPGVRVARARLAPPLDPATGFVEMNWPETYRLEVPDDWQSGLYLAKLTADGSQSYIQFVVRPPKPVPLVVMIPALTYQAYDFWDGASLYNWSGRAAPARAYRVSFDRPYDTAYGLATLMRADFPLLVWLENHGYSPGYVTDVDIAQRPEYVTDARTVVIAGHAEYWTDSMREAFVTAESRGVGVAAFGANLAYWQVRLEPSSDGRPDRTLVCYKEVALDPLAASEPTRATVRFDQLPEPKYASEIFGADSAGIIQDAEPFVVTPWLETFAPFVDLSAGQALPALLGGEVDQLSDTTRGFALAQTTLNDVRGVQIAPTASVWVSPGGAHVFDAGTFTWAWGLDARYAAALPGFPAEPFAHLTAAILAWVGATPTAP